MPEYLAPGVYIEETPSSPHPIEGVSTSTAGFIGVSNGGPSIVQAASFDEYLDAYGTGTCGFLPYAVRGFFENGGELCHIAAIAPGDPLQLGLDALAAEKLSIVCCPDEHLFPNAAALIAAHCEQLQDRVCVLQSPRPVMPDAAHPVPVHSAHAAYYYPWVAVAALDGVSSIAVPAGGCVAGVYARTDAEKGVHGTPAGVLKGVQGLSDEVGGSRAESLAGLGINVLRSFPGKGILVWGARTTSLDPEWRYVPVRRLSIYLERSIADGLQWAVFEANGPALWDLVLASVGAFLASVWRNGALVGNKPEEAYFVRCDRTTMNQDDIDNGRLVVLVGVAPVKPAEFVVFRIGLWIAAN